MRHSNRHTRQSRGAVSRADLPDLAPEVTLLESDADIRYPLQALTVDEVLLAGASGESTATWVDTGQYAQTKPLHQLAPSPRVLDRINIARGFTPFQHHSLVRQAVDALDGTSILLVVPGVDVPYRSSDLPHERAKELEVRVLAQLARVPRQYNIPVLVTRHGDDELAAAVEELASTTLTYRETRCGPRFEGSSHETFVYDVGDGWVQTTLAYWNQVLESRRPLYASADADITTSGEV
jgi:hypothetical protein